MLYYLTIEIENSSVGDDPQIIPWVGQGTDPYDKQLSIFLS